MLSPQEALITLNLIPGLGSMRIQALLDFFGSAEHVLHAPASMLANVPRIGPKLAESIADWKNCTNARAELDCAAQYNVRIVTLLDSEYPEFLRRMHDPPIVLYVRGNWMASDSDRSVAIVGTRQATPYGMTTARRFGCELADAGCTIISGLARGIDTAAHWGALDAGGRTLAVLGFGMASLYPDENVELADRICAGHGALVSEFPMYMRPSRTTFPQRNRIVAAWSRATLVVEAPQHSGSLHTANMAATDYGNSVFAIPGHITTGSSRGCHALIRDGATLCTSPRELLQDMNWSGHQQLELFTSPDAPVRRDTPQPQTSGDDAEALIKAIQAGHDTLDALCSALGHGAGELNPLLMRLQIARRITPLPGGRYAATR
ncbi:MAG: DNA-processing protein DprA [Akkermansia sp.]|nr:DNA-processing protein DprA [Akkermansia sp.]